MRADAGLPMAWCDADRHGLAVAADRRFRRVLARAGLPMLAFAIVVPLLQLELPRLPAPLLPLPPPTPMRVALLPPVRPVAAPAPVPVPAAKPARPAVTAPEPSAAPTPPAAAERAREQAQASGLLQLRDQLAALGERRAAAVEQPQAVTGDRPPARVADSGDALARSAAARSGGVAEQGRGDVSRAGAAGDLGARRTGRVRADGGLGSAAPSGSGPGGVAGRSLEDIQLGFDRSKHAFNAVFSRAARESTGLRAGRLVVSLTVAPDGSVTRCELVSSAFSDPALEARLLRLIRQMNFGARNVPSYTVPRYPIDYLPS